MSMMTPSVMISSTVYLLSWPAGVARTSASAASHAALTTGAKQVGPLSRTAPSALRYAARMPSTPWQCGVAGVPLSAKQCDTM